MPAIHQRRPPSRILDPLTGLLLCAPEVAHAANIVQAVEASLPALKAYMPFAHLPQTEDTQYDRLVKVCADYWRGDDFHLHLFDAASGALLGGLGLHRKAHHAHAMEIGYWIRSDRAGQGLCTHAAQMAVALAVHRFDCVRVQCVYDPSNAASARVAEKVGFQVECDLPGFLPTGTDAMRAEGWRVSGTARMTALSADRARAQPWWDDLVARLQWWDGQGRPVVDCA